VSNDCGKTDASKVVNVVDPPAAVRITVTKDTLAVAERAGVVYQWFANGTLLTGANGNRWIGQYNGSYVVRLTNAGGCTVYSDTVAYTVPKDTSGGSSVPSSVELAQVSPNPVAESVVVRLPDSWYGAVCLVVRDVTGGEVMRSSVDIANPSQEVVLSTASLGSGTYFLYAESGQCAARAVFVKLR
jgi:hypothetical protein